MVGMIGVKPAEGQGCWYLLRSSAPDHVVYVSEKADAAWALPWQGGEPDAALLPREAEVLNGDNEPTLPTAVKQGFILGGVALACTAAKAVIEAECPADCGFYPIKVFNGDTGQKLSEPRWLMVPRGVLADQGPDAFVADGQRFQRSALWLSPTALAGRDLWLLERTGPHGTQGSQEEAPEILISPRLFAALDAAGVLGITRLCGQLAPTGERRDPPTIARPEVPTPTLFIPQAPKKPVPPPQYAGEGPAWEWELRYFEIDNPFWVSFAPLYPSDYEKSQEAYKKLLNECLDMDHDSWSEKPYSDFYQREALRRFDSALHVSYLKEVWVNTQRKNLPPVLSVGFGPRFLLVNEKVHKLLCQWCWESFISWPVTVYNTNNIPFEGNYHIVHVTQNLPSGEYKGRSCYRVVEAPTDVLGGSRMLWQSGLSTLQAPPQSRAVVGDLHLWRMNDETGRYYMSPQFFKALKKIWSLADYGGKSKMIEDRPPKTAFEVPQDVMLDSTANEVQCVSAGAQENTAIALGAEQRDGDLSKHIGARMWGRLVRLFGK